MVTSFVGTCVAVSLTVIFVSLLLSPSRIWAKFLFTVGICLLLSGLGVWAVGDFVGGMSDSYALKVSTQQKAGIVAAMGLISTIIGAIGASKSTRQDE